MMIPQENNNLLSKIKVKNPYRSNSKPKHKNPIEYIEVKRRTNILQEAFEKLNNLSRTRYHNKKGKSGGIKRRISQFEQLVLDTQHANIEWNKKNPTNKRVTQKHKIRKRLKHKLNVATHLT